MIAFIGVFGGDMGKMQVHASAMFIVCVIVLTAVVRPFGSHLLLHFLEMGTLLATWVTLWAASVFDDHPRCEDAHGDTLLWCNTISYLVGLFNIGMMLAIVAAIVYYAKPEKCNTCCSTLKERAAGRRRQQSIARQEGERRSRMDSVAVTSVMNPMLDTESVQNNKSRERKKTAAATVSTFSNPSLNQMTLQRGQQKLTIEMRIRQTSLSGERKPVVVTELMKRHTLAAFPISRQGDRSAAHRQMKPVNEIMEGGDGGEEVLEVCEDDEGRKYVWDPKTGESNWFDEIDSEDNSEEKGMQILQDEDGDQYLWDPITGETRWLDEGREEAEEA